MRIEFDIIYFNGISKLKNSNEIYFSLITNIGTIDLPLNTLLKLLGNNKIYEIPGFIKNIAKDLRGKRLDSIHIDLQDLIRNMCKDKNLKEIFEAYETAAVICGILCIDFKQSYTNFFNACYNKDISVLYSDTVSQFHFYKRIVKSFEHLVNYEQESYKYHIKKFMNYFPDDIKLLAEVGEW